MPAYTPCPACQRHVRHTERACPFCASALPTRACVPGVPCAPIPRDAKRATVIALSLGLAASACADDNAVPIYGAPAPPQAGASGLAGRGGSGGSGGSAGANQGGTGGVNAGGNNSGGSAGAGGNSQAGAAGAAGTFDAGADPDAGDAGDADD